MTSRVRASRDLQGTIDRHYEGLIGMFYSLHDVLASGMRYADITRITPFRCVLDV